MSTIVSCVTAIAILTFLSVIWNYYMDRNAKCKMKKQKDYDFSIIQVQQGAFQIEVGNLRPVEILGDGNSEVKFSEANSCIQISDSVRIKVDG